MKNLAILLKSIISLSLLAFLLARMDLKGFLAAFVSANWTLVFLSAILYFSTVFISVVRWRWIIRNFRLSTAFGTLTRITLIGYFFNLFLPSAIGGDFFRAFYLARREKVGLSTTLTTTVLDRLSGLTALVIIALLASLTVPAVIEGQRLSSVLFLLCFLMVTLIPLLFHSSVHNYVVRLLSKLRLEGLTEKLELVFNGLQRVGKSASTVLAVTLLSLFLQLVIIISLWVASRAIEFDAPFLTFLLFIPVINLLTAIPLTINGVGLRENAYYLLFSQVGVPIEKAVALSLLNFVIAAATSLVGGLVYSLYKQEPDFPSGFSKAGPIP